MPREVKVWLLEEPSDEDHVICPSCNGWGGYDQTECYGFGAQEDWQTCPMCGGRGEVTKKFKEVWES